MRIVDSISDVAARWAVRGDAGVLSEQEALDLETWLSSDSRHRGAYVRACAQWVGLDRLSVLNGPVGSAAEDSSRGTCDADELVARRSFAADRMSRRRMLAATAASIAIAGGALTWAVRKGNERYKSGIGEVRRIALADGSTLLLNTDSEVTVELEKQFRNIRLLRGEAVFEVAHDKARPFVVRAKNTAVRAVGTAFAVRLDAERIDITVTEGVVEIADVGTMASLGPIVTNVPSPGVRRVVAHERALVGGTTTQALNVFPIASASSDRRLAWREGMLSFDGESLGEAVAEINRYNHRRIIIDDPILGQRPVVGVFRTTDLEGFAAAAAAALQARVVPDGNVIRLEPTALTSP
jgi:transmembrane sensor